MKRCKCEKRKTLLSCANPKKIRDFFETFDLKKKDAFSLDDHLPELNDYEFQNQISKTESQTTCMYCI